MTGSETGRPDEPTLERLDRAAARARSLLGSRTGGSGRGSGAGAIESSRSRVGPPDRADAQAISRQLAAVRAVPGAGGRAAIAGRGETAEVDALANALVERARSVMAQLEGGASDGSIGFADVVALESVIRTRGRPALAYEDGRVEAIDPDKHPGSGFWRTLLDDHEARLVRVGDATGAVVVRDKLTGAPTWVQGTAWLVKPDIAVTNRHVLFPPLGGVRPARRHAGRETEARIKDDYEVIVDFALDDGPPRDVRRVVVDVPYVSAERDPVDVAVLRLGAPAPAEVSSLSLSGTPPTPKQLYVVGHPGRMMEVPDEVLAVFGRPNGRKRVCFGELLPAAAARVGELMHDASTIGGFSGGCVMAFDSMAVTALHYYGDPLRGNYAIAAATLQAHAVAAHF